MLMYFITRLRSGSMALRLLCLQNHNGFDMVGVWNNTSNQPSRLESWDWLEDSQAETPTYSQHVVPNTGDLSQGSTVNSIPLDAGVIQYLTKLPELTINHSCYGSLEITLTLPVKEWNIKGEVFFISKIKTDLHSALGLINQALLFNITTRPPGQCNLENALKVDVWTTLNKNINATC
jgi:hypothetical protein